MVQIIFLTGSRDFWNILFQRGIQTRFCLFLCWCTVYRYQQIVRAQRITWMIADIASNSKLEYQYCRSGTRLATVNCKGKASLEPWYNV